MVRFVSRKRNCENLIDSEDPRLHIDTAIYIFNICVHPTVLSCQSCPPVLYFLPYILVQHVCTVSQRRSKGIECGGYLYPKRFLNCLVILLFLPYAVVVNVLELLDTLHCLFKCCCDCLLASGVIILYLFTCP